ncbi:MAG: hypothetical protein JXR80_04930 [Deltaproteobacteria bacterium]|nr:hypothetical protein [Deltaproteobacteria bacterium]
MKKLFRILLITGVLCVGLLVVAGIVLKAYLTEERLRTMLLPPLREALGREVEVASLNLDLFSGIKIGGLVVKEADGKADFVAVREFSLGYSLWPLLEKRLEITRVRIEQPVIRVWRDRQGLYNFAGLKMLQKGPASPGGEVKKTSSDKDSAAVLPLALVVQHCEITGAVLSFYDATGELPKLDLKADMKSRLDLGDLKPESIRGQGELRFSLVVEYQGLSPQAQGKVEFDRRKMVYRVVLQQADEACTVSGSVKDFLGSRPQLVLDLESARLNLAYLAGLGQKLSVPAPAGKGAEPAKPAKVSKSVPPSPPALTAQGKVQIKEAVYENYKVENFALEYQYQDALLTISDLRGGVAGGSFAAAATVKPFLERPDFQGNFSFAELKLAALMAMAAPALQDNLSGVGQGKFQFSGRGSDAVTLKKSLSLAGDYGLSQGAVNNLPLTQTLAQLLGLPELEHLKVDDLTGNIRLKDGQVKLDSSWNGTQLRGQAKGDIGLDGGLDLPLQLVLNRSLSAEMAQRYPWVKEAFNDKQEAAVGLVLAGTLSSPRLRLDEKKAQEQLQKTLEKKLLDKLGEAAGKNGGTKSKTIKPDDLLRQFFKN